MEVILRLTALGVGGVMFALVAVLPAIGHERPANSGKLVELPVSGKITVVGKEFKFIPSAIRVKEDQQVTIVFKNEGRLSHNLTIPELGLHTDTIQSGTQATIHFTAKRTGTYQFWCTVPGHKQAGMIGKVSITK